MWVHIKKGLKAEKVPQTWNRHVDFRPGFYLMKLSMFATCDYTAIIMMIMSIWNSTTPDCFPVFLINSTQTVSSSFLQHKRILQWLQAPVIILRLNLETQASFHTRRLSQVKTWVFLNLCVMPRRITTKHVVPHFEWFWRCSWQTFKTFI